MGSEHLEPDAVAGPEVVLGDGGGGPDPVVQAAAFAVETGAATEVLHRVDEEEDLAVLVGVRRGDVQLAGAHRDRPVDPPQPVAEAERADVGELAAVTVTAGAAPADEAVGVRCGTAGRERLGQGHGRHRCGLHGGWRPDVGAEGAAHGAGRRAERAQPPAGALAQDVDPGRRLATSPVAAHWLVGV